MILVGTKIRRQVWMSRSQASATQEGEMIMMKTMLSALVALGLLGSAVSSASAHRAALQGAMEPPVPIEKPWLDDGTSRR